ncbi:hypothetical protein Y032_0252g238 [Ancylostoma ceylanicum]|uniref:Uncharacterized protein n=1 Tax=Ancylostoma ceylanicum TaxID=53326 RepID=A0A016SCN6_9BILA|nr:hypothetical protein Y032_0252g238 [Ancylostoma ceylanicum]
MYDFIALIIDQRIETDESIDPGESGKFSQAESNNNESVPPQVSSSRSDSDSTVSPTAPRHNVIVKNHSKRKKVRDQH